MQTQKKPAKYFSFFHVLVPHAKQFSKVDSPGLNHRPYGISKPTAKQVNFTANFILQDLWEANIHRIR